MSPSIPLRQPRPRLRLLQAESNPLPRSEAALLIVRSIPMAIAAVAVIATSNYLSYLIGQKQVTYEELRRQVDRVVRLTDEKRVEDRFGISPLKHEDKLEQSSSALTGLTTSTIKGKTTVVPALAPAVAPMPTVEDTAFAPVPPDSELRLQPPQSSPTSVTNHREARANSHQRPRRLKMSVARSGQTGQAFGDQPQPAPDVGLAGQ